MKIGVPRETVPGERRVALVPDAVEKLGKTGAKLVVETGAGASAFFSDAAYQSAGATIVDDARALYAEADLIAKVHKPADAEMEFLRAGTSLIAFLQPRVNTELVQQLASRSITAFSMDSIPRIARAQALDALSSMSSIAGYAAALLVARSLPRFLPLMMTAAGTMPPAKIFVIGAGVAGLQAIATARRLGAVVSAFDTRPAVKEQVQSLGATFVDASIGAADTEDKGGYAKELSDEAHKREVELIGERVLASDAVITTALVPGKRAPVLITAQMVGGMKPGSVIVDLAGEAGGNCELSRPGETVEENGVTIHAPLNLPSSMPMHASQMYSRNISSLLQLLMKDGDLQLNFEDQIVRDTCVTHEGRVMSASSG
ncbi:MAG: Re/Si-specific NAD(P)(+) transhydrogenase subunit alpha [Gemmatimonadaceae bacterium]